MMNNTLDEVVRNITVNTSIEWKSQDSKSNSILFYKFNSDSEIELNKCLERLSRAEFKVCITNSSKPISIAGVHCISDELYLEVQEEILNKAYPYNKDLIFLGVTGTNGKTTTVDLIRQICVLNKIDVLSIGTLGVFRNEEHVEDFHLTSPSYIDLRKSLFKHAQNIKVVAVELSSHALVQDRFGKLVFNGIAWTNLSQDHLDYHHTMEEYLQAKKTVFKIIKKNKKVLLPKAQTKLAKEINESHRLTLVEFTTQLNNPFFKISYNLENLSLAVSLLTDIFSIDEKTIESLIAPPGRFNIIAWKDSYIIIDYAHTPDGLSSICGEIKKEFPSFKLITLFGCGGDRDRTKRPLMAKAAQDHSDYVILTTDNPRFEDPIQIINDAKVELRADFEIIVERVDAIKAGFKLLNKSILLIAGKGHEDYLDVEGVKKPYSDFKEISRLMHD